MRTKHCQWGECQMPSLSSFTNNTSKKLELAVDCHSLHVANLSFLAQGLSVDTLFSLIMMGKGHQVWIHRPEIREEKMDVLICFRMPAQELRAESSLRIINNRHLHQLGLAGEGHSLPHGEADQLCCCPGTESRQSIPADSPGELGRTLHLPHPKQCAHSV